MPKGYPKNPELTREKMRESAKKRIMPKSWIINVRKMIIKRNKSKKNIEKVRKALMGHECSLATRMKISKNQPNKNGENNPKWKGGWYIHKYRFIYSPNHPLRNLKGYVREHLLVIYKILGKKITKSVIIHHIDGNKLNNNINNLMVMKNHGSHRRIHCNKTKDGDILFDGRKLNV